MKPAIYPQLPLTETVEWLLRSGFKASTPGALLGELCRRLVKEGLPIAHVILGIASLDPLISATRLRWQSDGGRVIEEVMLHGMASRVSAQNDALRFTFADTNHLIEWRSDNDIGFTAQEQAYLGAVCMAMAAPLEVVIGRSVTRNVLQAYLGRRSADKVLNGTVRHGIGEVIEA